jgi:hypothetical protein
MSRILKALLLFNLVVLTVLVFAFPNLMVGPGKLVPGHKALETDCFACHAAFTGVSPAKCASCHKAADIGRLTTKGQPIVKPRTATPFHQQLSQADCTACHSDHAGVKRYARPGRFNHGLLDAATRNTCQSCHKAPADAFHAQLKGNCTQCHTQAAWTPANFEHQKYFVLDRDHSAACVTCHASNDYSRYTCYGCHEHSVANIRRKHIEEGVSAFDNCVQCHRSANKHDIQGGEGGGGGESKGRKGRSGGDDD